MAHSLSFSIYEKIDDCQPGEEPVVDNAAIPSCIPADVEYNNLFKSFNASLERAIYNTIPEQIQVDLNTTVTANGITVGSLIERIDDAKLVVYISMLVIIALIALLIFAPFSAILLYVGTTFILSGLLGVASKYILIFYTPAIVNEYALGINYASVYQLTEKTVLIFGNEIQKVAMVSVVLGLVLVLIRVFVKHNREY
jgi:hypothetical protein